MIIIDINKIPKQPVLIGHSGENLWEEVHFNVLPWLEQYPDATVAAVIRRAGDQLTYPLFSGKTDPVIVWQPTRTDIKYEGVLIVELHLMFNDTLGKSDLIRFYTKESLSDTDERPDEPASWVDEAIFRVEEIVRRANSIAVHPPIVGENSNWWTWDVTIEDYVDSGLPTRGIEGPTGPVGKSPYVGENGNWFFWDDTAADGAGDYVDSGVSAQGEAAAAAAEAAQAAAEAAAAAAASGAAEALRNTQFDLEQDEITGRMYQVVNGQRQGEGTPVSSGGLAFNSGYQDASGFIHLTRDGEDLPEEDFVPFHVAGGGGGGSGGGGSKLTFSITSPLSFTVLDSDEHAYVTGTFASTDIESEQPTGPASVQVEVGGAVVTTVQIQPGSWQIDVRRYLTNGSNTIRLICTDSYGTSATRRLSGTLETFAVNWSLGSTLQNTGNLELWLEATGSGAKTVTLIVDGETYSEDTIGTGVRLTKRVTGLSHGAHRVEAYGTMQTSGGTVTSDRLTCAVAQIVAGNRTPMVAANWPSGNLQQFTAVTIPYLAIDPLNNPSTVYQLVNGTAAGDPIYPDQTEQSWTYRPTEDGALTLGIMCGTTLEEHEFTVDSIGVDVAEVTDGLAVKLDPATMNDIENWTDGGYTLEMSPGFDLVNGGLQTVDGVRCIRIVKGDRLTLNYPIFGGADVKRTGKAVKIIYRVENSTDLNGDAISCYADGIGLQIHTNDVMVSTEQNSVKMDTFEEYRTELDVNIERDTEHRLMFLWESCSTFMQAQYGANDSFSQATAPGVTFGSDTCDVYLYLFRGYDRNLTANELLRNFIADGKDAEEIIARSNRNQIYDASNNVSVQAVATLNPDVHVITWHAARFSHDKKNDNVDGYWTHECVSLGEGHTFTAPDAQDAIQGTSSVEHESTAGGNHDMIFKHGVRFADGSTADGYAMHEGSIPVNRLTFKKNIASQEHIINKAMSDYLQEFQPVKRAARVANPAVRDAMESAMAVMFFHNTGSAPVQIGPDLVQPNQTIFFGLGNLCNSKKNDNAFQYDPIVIEVKNNTEAPVRFKSDDLSNFDDNFEFRYLDEEQFTEDEAKALWQEFVTFVYECDITAATNSVLSPARRVGDTMYVRDTAEYRAARWREEAWQHLDKSSVLFFQNFTLNFLGRDNRAKNMFWSYDPESGLWRLVFPWDHDTFLCVNNEGYHDIDAGHLDTDRVGDKDVFNAADNTLFANNRAVFAAELRQDYLDRETAGCWDPTALMNYIDQEQGKICEALWIEDVMHNAIRTLTNLGTDAYLARGTGRKRLLLKKSIVLQNVFMSSYYRSTAATSDQAAFRSYNPTSAVHTTTYCDMFVNVHIGSVDRQVRATAGVPVSVNIQTDDANDSETQFYNAHWLKDLGDLSPLKVDDCRFQNMVRATRFKLGSSEAGYSNANLQTASFGNSKSLEVVDLSGCVNAARDFDFSENLMLREFYSTGSGVTGVTFAKFGRLQTAAMNAIASLYVSNLTRLQRLTMESSAALRSLTIEDTPGIDSYALASAATGLNRVRLINLAWTDTPLEGYYVLKHLANIYGIDDNKYTVAGGVLTGSVHFTEIGENMITELRRLLPNVTFTYTTVLAEHTVTFVCPTEDGEQQYQVRVAHGHDAPDPVASGELTPYKEPTAEYSYSFSGWDKPLENITADVTITAQFTAFLRRYTVRFYAADNYGAAIVQTSTVNAGERVEYTGAAITAPTGYVWGGWQTQTNAVYSDLDVFPWFIQPTAPTAIKDTSRFDYVYSDDPNDNAAYTFEEFWYICQTPNDSTGDPLAWTYFTLGDKIKIVPNTTVFADQSIVLRLEAFKHFRTSDLSGWANTVWGMVGVMNAQRSLNSTQTNSNGWPSTSMRTWLNGTCRNALPLHWQAVMVEVEVLSSKGGTSTDIVSSRDYMFLRSYAETHGVTTTPYGEEVAEGADSKRFPIYNIASSNIKYFYNGTGSASNWWLRSPNATSTTNFWFVTTGGGATNGNPTTAYGVSFCFCIGSSAIAA